MRNTVFAIMCISALMCIAACASIRKLENIRSSTLSAGLAMSDESTSVADTLIRRVARDTLMIKDDEGREMLLMKSVRDEETGEMVASEELDAVVVTAVFRNVAERGGKVGLDFRISVPSAMMDSRWQIRLHPRLIMLGDTTAVDDVILTGSEFRKVQLKGYQQYDRFVARIITDSTRFIDLKNLETFIKRNIPELYAFKTDSSFVSDERFYSAFGVGSREAAEHYTDDFAVWRNESRKSRKGRIFLRYVRNPIMTENVRLDTVISSQPGDFTYNYTQILSTRPGLRKIEVFLDGEIVDSEKKLYSIPAKDTVTFYVSSMSMFADTSMHFKTVVLERRISENMVCNLGFKAGKSDIDTLAGSNAAEIGRITGKLDELLSSDEFEPDSIVVESSASPDGKYFANAIISSKRSHSISSFISDYISFCPDTTGRKAAIRVISKSKGENWELFSKYIDMDTVITIEQKKDFNRLLTLTNPDKRESDLRLRPYFGYLQDRYYPALRSSSIAFHMHRKGMVKDTLHTSIPDTVYMNGVRALKDMDYNGALEILRDYGDYNTAVAYVGLGRNRSALDILEKIEETAETHYLISVIQSRRGEIGSAVEHYIEACRMNPFYIHRGNLDPEISSLISLYNLNRDEFEIP